MGLGIVTEHSQRKVHWCLTPVLRGRALHLKAGHGEEVLQEMRDKQEADNLSFGDGVNLTCLAAPKALSQGGMVIYDLGSRI